MTAREALAIAAVAFCALPPALRAQGDMVPTVVAPASQSRPRISGRTAAIAGSLFAFALVGDREFREEAQEHRGTTSDAMASVGNSSASGATSCPRCRPAFWRAGSREAAG